MKWIIKICRNNKIYHQDINKRFTAWVSWSSISSFSRWQLFLNYKSKLCVKSNAFRFFHYKNHNLQAELLCNFSSRNFFYLVFFNNNAENYKWMYMKVFFCSSICIILIFKDGNIDMNLIFRQHFIKFFLLKNYQFRCSYEFFSIKLV